MFMRNTDFLKWRFFYKNESDFDEMIMVHKCW